MIDDAMMEEALANPLDMVEFPDGALPQRGKVREWCVRDGVRYLVTTDRISAFDCLLGTIPFKGQVLNQLAAFWFRKMNVPHHVIDVPDPNILVAHECEQLPLEFVVRGYITGVTETSAWTHYSRGVRDFCGNKLPDGLRKDQRLERPIVTPTTKHEKHDRNVSREEAVAEGLISESLFDEASAMCLSLYEAGVAYAASRGLILVDTKYELGLLNGKLVFSDEINTPDSSRYWFAEGYEAALAKGESPRKLDKEYVREWLASQGFRGEGTPPALTDEVRKEAARRYIETYELITGETFVPAASPAGPRVAEVLDSVVNRAS